MFIGLPFQFTKKKKKKMFASEGIFFFFSFRSLRKKQQQWLAHPATTATLLYLHMCLYVFVVVGDHKARLCRMRHFHVKNTHTACAGRRSSASVGSVWSSGDHTLN